MKNILKLTVLFLIICQVNSACKSTQKDKMEIDKPIVQSSQTILGLGDSYTYGQSVDTASRYLTQLYTLLKTKDFKIEYPKIIAQTGWTTAEMLAAVAADSDKSKYDFVFLLIGVNNEYRGMDASTYQPQFKTCLDTAIARCKNGASHVFVVSIPDYSVTRFAGRKSLPNATSDRIDVYNKINKKIADDNKVNYIEITVDSRLAYNNSALIANDGLHPSALMYEDWANKIIPVIEPLLHR